MGRLKKMLRLRIGGNNKEDVGAGLILSIFY